MERVFFSYGRADKDFVLRLAKDLRAKGVNLWIDQLDIAPGDRWDRAVEEALAAASCLVVVLSPEAVESQNVMDEVSWAFDENKKIVPILVKPCAIPFRLRRLQHIDFTAGYDAAVALLVRALQNQREVAHQNPGHTGASTGGSPTTSAALAAPRASTTPNKTWEIIRPWLGLALMIIIGVAAGMLIGHFKSK